MFGQPKPAEVKPATVSKIQLPLQGGHQLMNPQPKKDFRLPIPGTPSCIDELFGRNSTNSITFDACGQNNGVNTPAFNTFKPHAELDDLDMGAPFCNNNYDISINLPPPP